MTVVSVVKDPEARTLTITARFDAPIERVWRIWSDPRQLERWWGPPGYPATVMAHDLSPGGTVTYFMTDPDGVRHGGWWRMRWVEPPRGMEFDSGFADPEGTPTPGEVVGVVRVALSEWADGGTQMEIATSWSSDEDMARMLATGVDEGMAGGVGQIDELLR